MSVSVSAHAADSVGEISDFSQSSGGFVDPVLKVAPPLAPIEPIFAEVVSDVIGKRKLSSSRSPGGGFRVRDEAGKVSDLGSQDSDLLVGQEWSLIGDSSCLWQFRSGVQVLVFGPAKLRIVSRAPDIFIESGAVRVMTPLGDQSTYGESRINDLVPKIETKDGIVALASADAFVEVFTDHSEVHTFEGSVLETASRADLSQKKGKWVSAGTLFHYVAGADSAQGKLVLSPSSLLNSVLSERYAEHKKLVNIAKTGRGMPGGSYRGAVGMPDELDALLLDPVKKSGNSKPQAAALEPSSNVSSSQLALPAAIQKVDKAEVIEKRKKLNDLNQSRPPTRLGVD